MIFQTLELLAAFLIIISLSFYPLGYLLLGKNIKELKGVEKISLSFATSLVLFVILSVFLSLINARFLLLYIILALNIWAIYKYRWALVLPWKDLLKNKVLLILLFLGILVEGFITFPSGYPYSDGLLFWSSQGFDGLWYISLIKAIAKGIPPITPVYSGMVLQNYHYLIDIFMGEFYRIYSFFSVYDLYFRFFPVFLSFLLGVSIFSFVRRWKNEKVAYWSLFFTYFVGSFGFIVTYLKSGKIFGGETAFWVSQLNTIVANPPHASAMILLSSFLLAFLMYIKNKTKSWFFISLLVGSIVAGFKVSGGATLLAGLGITAFIEILKNKNFKYMLMFLILLLTNFFTLHAISPNAVSFLVFEPWWFIRTMVVVKLDLVDWELRRQTYLSVGRFTSYLRVLQLEGTAFLIFLVGNLGIRIIGLPIIADKLVHFKKKIIDSPIDTFLLSSALIAFLVPMLFLQKGVAWVSVQFMQYVLLIVGFYGAVFIYSFSKKIKRPIAKYIFILAIIVLALPTVIGNFVEFYGNPPNAIISNSEISALSFLEGNSNPNDIILTPPYNKYAKDEYNKNPLPIYAWFGTAYVSALTGRNTFLDCEEQLQIMGYDVDTRKEMEEMFFSQNDIDFNNNFLLTNNIAYVYVPNPSKYSLDETKNNLTKVFTNDEVAIYKVNKNEK